MTTKLSPETTALILLDLQNAHINMIGDHAEPYLATIASTIAAARSLGIKIAHCRVAFTPDEISLIPTTNSMFNRFKSDPTRAAHYLVDAQGSQFHRSVEPESGDILIRKTRTGAFISGPEDVNKIFRDSGIDTLVLAGVATGGAVLSTVVQAADLDYRLVVLEDGCWDGDKEMHNNLIKFMRKRAEIIQSEELKGLFEL